MNLQKNLLRTMLWLLGLAAAAGVLTVFLSTRVMGRVAGTAFMAAVAMGAAMPLSRMLDDEKKRAGGTLSLLGVVVGFLAGLGAVWVGLLNTRWDLEMRLALTSLIAGLGLVLGGVLLANFHVGWARWSARVALVADLLAAALLLGSAWGLTDKPAQSAGQLLFSAAATALALLGLGIERRSWRWIGVLASVAGLALGIAGTYFVDSDDPSVYVATMSVACVVAYAIAVLRVPLGESRFWVLFASIGSTGALCGCVSALSFITGGFDSPGPELLSRATGALGIMSACSTLALFVIHRLNKRPPGSADEVCHITSVALTCPHCSKRLNAPVGESACGGCGLVLTVAVREPRCARCGYSMWGIKGAACPECGSAATQ